MIKQAITFFLIISIPFIVACKHKYSKSKEVVINIKTEGNVYGDKNFDIGYPFFSEKIKLDKGGKGEITLSIENPSFAKLNIEGAKAVSLFLESDHNLSIILKEDEIYFSGKGSTSNRYLQESNLLKQQFIDSILTIKDYKLSHDHFIEVCDFFELKHQIFHNKYKDSLFFTEKASYLLENNFRSSVFSEKYNLLLYFTKNEIDSLDLNRKLGITDHNLYEDTLLIEASSYSFVNFLSKSCSDFITKKVPIDQLEDVKLFPLYSHDSINNSLLFNEKIKEFMLFDILILNIHNYGFSNDVDSLVEYMRITYPEARQFKQIDRLYEKFGNLFIGNDAPDFEFRDVNGKKYSLSDYKGKILFIDVWATWCLPCKKAFPFITKLQKSLKDKDIVFLFISTDKDENQWKEFLAKNPQLKGVHSRLDDNKFKKAYIITGIPMYILVDREGKIIDAFARSYEEIKSILKVLTK